jgi:hypothetical protein
MEISANWCQIVTKCRENENQIISAETQQKRQFFFLTTWLAEICEADPRVYYNNHGNSTAICLVTFRVHSTHHAE